MSEVGIVSIEEINRRLYTVGHVHHGQSRVFGEKALVLSFFDCRVKDVDSIVSGASSGQTWRDDPRVSETTKVDLELAVIVFSEKFQINFTDAIDGGGVHDGLVGRLISWGRRSECCDAARSKYFELVVLADIENVFESYDVDIKGQIDVLFAFGREDPTEMNDISDAIVDDEPLDTLLVQYVGIVVLAFGEKKGPLDDISDDDVVRSMFLLESRHQLQSDLAARSCDQITFLCG